MIPTQYEFTEAERRIYLTGRHDELEVIFTLLTAALEDLEMVVADEAPWPPWQSPISVLWSGA